MATKTKLTVQTEVGTFTRTTSRPYTHLVVSSRYTDDYIARTLAGASADGRAWHEADIARHAEGFGTLSWNGSLKNAIVSADSWKRVYADIRIYEVATGRHVS